LDTPVLIWDAPPDVTFSLRSTLAAAKKISATQLREEVLFFFRTFEPRVE